MLLWSLLFVMMICVNISVFGQKLTLQLGKIPLREALKTLQAKVGYDFVYNANEINVEQLVELQAAGQELEEVLVEMLNPLGLTCTKEGHIIILRKKQMQVKQQALVQKFKGIVKDEDGNPVPGVTVRLKGSSFGTTTDIDGKFSISVPEGKEHVLLFSFVGMEPLEVACTAGMNSIVMKESVTVLEEATVTTGYQTISKTRMTGAVEMISAKDITNKGYSSVGDILKGAMAGVSTRSTSGKLGATPEIRIRGLNSLYGNMTPTWIVDGVPFYGNLNDLVPEDIESITVLKDAAATAIYGSQAANGVIVVKRKQGREGAPLIRVTSTFSVESAPHSKLDLMNTQEKIAFERSVYEDFPNLAVGGRVITLLKDADLGKISEGAAEAEIARLSKINTNWYDVIFKNPFSHNHNLSFSGGTDKNRYYISVGIRESRGVVPTNKYSNWNAMVRFSHDLNKRISFAFNLSSNVRKDRDSDAGVSILHYATFANPYEQPYDENGNYAYDRSYAYQLSSLKDGYQDDFNILKELYNNTTCINTLSNTMSLELNVKILDNLKFTTIGSLSNSFSNTETILGAGTYTAKKRAWIRQLYSEFPDELNKGSLTERDGRSRHYTWQNRLEFMHSFRENHYLNLFLGHEISESTNYNNSTLFPEYDQEKGLYSIPEIGEDKISYVQKLITNLMDRSESRNRSVSFFLSASYSYQDRYVISGSVRMDGADIIGSKNRFSPLWNASFKYNIHNEKFMRNQNWINELALRFSYGYTGSIDKQALPFNVLTYSMNSEFMDNLVPSFITPKNPSVKWQKKEDRSLGVDLAFFKNRLRATVNYYNTVTSDLLDQKTLPISVGISSIRYNSSSVRNYGWELSFHSINIRKGDFAWSTFLNFSVNRNKILESYYKTIQDIPIGSARTEPVEGTSANSWIGYRFAGIDPLTGHTLAYVDNANRKNPIGFQQEDGTWVLDMDDQSNRNDKKLIKESLGDSYPPFSGGFGTTLTWKQLVLTSRFVFMAGHKITSAYFAVASSGNIASAAQNVLRQEANRWRKPGDITDIPGYNSTGMSTSLQSDWYDRKLESGNFLKCSEISLGYHLPAKICRKILLESCRINLNIRDIFTFSKYKGLDPENFGGFGYPNSRKYMLSLSVGI